MPMSTTDKLNMLTKIVNLLRKENCFQDVCIYIDNRRYFSEKCDWHKNQKFDDDLQLWYQDDIDVTDYIEYSNPDTLTISFEGPLYHALNYGDGKLEKKLNQIAKTYGLYLEYGYAWSLSFYEA